METRKETYKGKEIIFGIPDDPNYIGEIELEIDGKHIHMIKMEDGTYGAHLLPYANYSSIMQLARDVIEKVPEFKGGLVT